MTKILNTDVAIIGAGPAGSTAAHRLSQQGIKTILIDKEAFPRNKTCGDGVTSEGLEVLKRTGLENWIENQLAPSSIRFFSNQNNSLKIDLFKQYKNKFRIIQREVLDQKLVQSAIEAGCHFLEKTNAIAIQHRKNENPVIITKDFSIQAEMAILAIGANNSIAKRSGIPVPEANVVAIRQYYQGEFTNNKEIEVHIYKDIAPWYYWIFPENYGLLNIGTGMDITRKSKVNIKSKMENFLAWHKNTYQRLSSHQPIGRISGHLINTNFHPRYLISNRILLAGESSGLVSPLTGEGIGPALVSGELAADTIISCFSKNDFSRKSLYRYMHLVKEKFWKDILSSRFLHSLLKQPVFINHGVKNIGKEEILANIFGSVLLGLKSPQAIINPKILFQILK